MAAAIWRVSNHPSKQQQQSHSRSHSSPAVVLGSSGTAAEQEVPVTHHHSNYPPNSSDPTYLQDSEIDSDLPSEFSASNRRSLPSSSQSLVLLHQPSHPIPISRRPLTSSGIPQPLQLTTSNDTTTEFNAENSLDSPTAASNTSTSYATLSLLDAVGTGSGRRKLKEFPGYIPLSRYFIPPSATTTPVTANTPTTPTVPSFHKADIEGEVPDTEGTVTPNSVSSSVTVTAADEEEKRGETVAQQQTSPSGQIDGTTEMEPQPPVAIIGDPEPLMTQDLLNFYKNRLHELEKSTHAELLERISVLRGFLLEHHDATNRLETQLHELQAENTSLSKELEDSVKHRMDMIALVKENERLKEKIEQLSTPKNPLDQNIFDPTPIPSPDPSVTGSAHSKELDPEDPIQVRYEELIQQVLTKFNEQTAARETERTLANQNIDHLNDRCRRLETAVSDSLKDIIQERSKRVGLEERLKETEEELNVSVFEMQSQLEIFERHINESRTSPVDMLQTVHEEEGESDHDVLPMELLEDIPDFADNVSARASPIRRKTGSPIRRKTPSPTKKRRTPSPVPLFNDVSVQTIYSEPADVRELRQELEDMISERQAEEALLKAKKAEFEDAYQKFAGIVEQARAREEDYNNLKLECEDLRIHLEELLEQHELDQEELVNRQNDIDQTYNQLEESLKQGVLDKAELTRRSKEIEELKKQLEENDVVSIIQDDTELKNLRLQIDEARREKGLDEEMIKKATEEIETLKERVEKLSKQHSSQIEVIEKGNIEIQGLRIQLESLTKQRSSDLETISKANAEIESLRSQIERSNIASAESTNAELAALRTRLSEAETAKSSLEKEKSRKEGDIKLLREQMQGLLRGQSTKDAEITRAREDFDNLKKRYDELVSDRKRDEEWRHENFMELEAVRQRLSDVMRIKDQEHSLHQRDADAWKRQDEENQRKLGEVSGRLAEMVLDLNNRNDIMKELNETIINLKLADEASSLAIEDAKKRIAELEREVQEEKRRLAVEITKANEKVAEIEEMKMMAEERATEAELKAAETQERASESEASREAAEEEAESLKAMIQDLEERIRGYEMAVEANEDSNKRIVELEHRLLEANAQLDQIAMEANMEAEAFEREIEEAKAHAVEVAQEANRKIEIFEKEIFHLKQHAMGLKDDGDAKIRALERELLNTKAHAEKQITTAEDELKKLETQMKVDEAKASAMLAAAAERLALLEKQIKTYEALKRHKLQDESDLQSLKSHVVKIERLALQFLPLEDSGMLNAIDELKRSHLETQQKHKKRRKKEMIMAERCGIEF
ncbi:hypothetical protein ABW19_dt0204085 [Dactylella cylindrospora]|nr:hypothetical protein ABW19_dt0204085 [Dactylella cylindrospora]